MPDLWSLTRGAFMRASFSERLVVQLSVKDTGRFHSVRIGVGAPLGAAVRAGFLGASGVRLGARASRCGTGYRQHSC